MSLKNFEMYQLALKGVRLVRPLIAEIAKHDRDLAVQLRKSVTSVPLNIAEGCESRKNNRLARYADARGSANEVVATLESAEALGYLRAERIVEPVDIFDHVGRGLFKMS